MAFWELGQMVLRAIPQALARPDYLMVISIVLLLVHMQYARVAAMERHMFGLTRTQPVQQTLQALVLGVLGGLLATVLFVVLGISLFETAIGVLWVLALLLMLVHPRFLCFSYAGGLLSLSYLLFGVPQLDVASVMGLVAALHLVEGLLVWVSGHLSPSPMYIKAENGEVVGGFALQKAWPIPFVALVAVAMGRDMMDAATMLQMPDWWPLIRPTVEAPSGQHLVYFLFPVVAALAYADFTVTRDPRKKARQSAGGLFLFSFVLLGLALLGERWPPALWMAALFSPVGHDLLIQWGRWQERHHEPVFVSRRGVMVLDVLPEMPAAKMGLRPGDLIVGLNGQPVTNRHDLQYLMEPWLFDAEFEVENHLAGAGGHGPRRRLVHYAGRLPPLGIVPAPEPDEPRYVTLHGGGLFVSRLLGRLRDAVRRHRSL